MYIKLFIYYDLLAISIINIFILFLMINQVVYLYNNTDIACRGGGSGGSVLLSTHTLEGYGTIAANGGQSSYAGGSGGRIAVYFQKNNTMDGFKYVF